MFCNPRQTCVMPAVIHPTKHCVNNTYQTVVVPHVHPIHTTTVNHVNYLNQHHYPHTCSTQKQQTVQNVNVGPVNNCCNQGQGQYGQGQYGQGQYGQNQFGQNQY